MTQPSRDEKMEAAVAAFVYGYPLEYCVREIAKIPAAIATVVPEAAPWNTFGCARSLLGPETEFVSPNNDTLYVIAPLDLSAGPQVLHVPDTAGRYYVLQFVDAWSNNFAYLGRRATGTAEGRYVLVGPDWKPGEAANLPDDAVTLPMVQSPTTVAIIVGRIQVDGEQDLPTVHDLQDQFTLTPLFTGARPAGIPDPTVGVTEGLMFWERLRTYLAAFRPPATEADLVESLARLGLTAAESPYVDPDPDLASLLTAAKEAGEQRIERLMSSQPASPTGWQAATHIFDYNTHALELGTIDSPEWRIDDPTRKFAARAVAARAGLWGNHGYEAAYFLAFHDADGTQLNGGHRYELQLTDPPPVDAFWSLTMYDVPKFYLVDNPADRYSIGDRTPGLVVAADGSITVYLQTSRPTDEAHVANWLPTPPGPFRPVMRMYQPQDTATDGTYQLPAIRRTG